MNWKFALGIFLSWVSASLFGAGVDSLYCNSPRIVHAQELKPKPIDWRPCKEIITSELSKKVSDFNSTHAHEGLSIFLSCLKGRDETAPLKPEEHISLTPIEISHLSYFRKISDDALDVMTKYENYLIAAHHVRHPAFGDPCWYFVGIKVDDDFITVDKNTVDPSCE